MATRTAQPDARAALAARRENGGMATNTLADQIRGMEKQYQAAMPRGAEAAQLVRDALTALRMTPKLAECEHTSVLGALMTCAQLGLRPGVLGHAWLLPFWDNKTRGNKAQLVIGYQGLIELAHRSGKISSLIARTVYRNDEFEVDYGLADSLVHRPNLFEERGEAIAYYAIAKFTTGGHAFIVMTQKEMIRYRDLHAKAKTREGKIFGPWVDNFEGMAHKTCIRQLSKYMPKSTELAVALAADEGVRVDLTPTADPAESTVHPDYIDSEVVDTPTSGADEPGAGEPPQGDADQPQATTGGGRPCTAKQQQEIAMLSGELDMDRDGKLAYLSDLVGRTVASSKELTNREAAQVIAKMQAFKAQQEPSA
ncbi:recombination protein RecT [Micromonospora sp. ATA32]|nr:recombination protein RecT [Micromonospora sp. ATA32]